MARKKGKGTELSVFKGREARLNRAILKSLALKGPQTIYKFHKKLRSLKGLRRTYYGNVNKRVRTLEKLGYLKAISTKVTKAVLKPPFTNLAEKLTLLSYLTQLV